MTNTNRPEGGEPDRIDLHTTEVDLSGLLSVLGSNLYSSPEIALREIVQNAHDACLRRAIEQADAPPPQIRVGTAREPDRLWIEDNGSGLTADEMRRYLATIGAGYTRVLRSEHDNTGLIGAFGLGFLSAYMIGRRVEVVSTSAASPDIGTRFVTDSGRTYALRSVPRRAIGSRIEIELKPELAHLADPAAIAAVLRHHGCLLRLPVVLDASGETINTHQPPWREAQSNLPPIRLRRERLDFAEAFEPVFTPICTLPLGAPDIGGGGLVWIHDAGTYGSTDNRRLGVFVNGMRVCGNERDLLPAWAGFVSGVYESATLTPTTSREDVRHDAAYFDIRTRIARDLAAGLAALPAAEPEAWRRVLRRHNESLLGAAIADDDLFEALADELNLPTSAGDLTARQVADQSGDCLYVATADEEGAEGLLAHTLGAPVVNGLRYGAFAFARKWAALRGVRLVDLGSSKSLEALFPEADLDAGDRAALDAWFGAAARVRPARFAPAGLPLLIHNDQAARTKAMIESDQADARIHAGALGLARMFTATVAAGPERVVIVNLDNPAVARILARRDSPRGRQAATLLAAMGEVMAARSRGDAATRLPDRLGDFSAALLSLLEDPS